MGLSVGMPGYHVFIGRTMKNQGGPDFQTETNAQQPLFEPL